MNGRMYDPMLGRFLAVDPFIQDPSASQSFNGYSYCFNNPLKYIDPSGYVLENPVSIALELLSSPYGGSWKPGSLTVERSFEEYNNLNLAFGLIVQDLFPSSLGGLASYISVDWCTYNTDRHGGVAFTFRTYDFYEYYTAFNRSLSLSYLAFFGPYTSLSGKKAQGEGGDFLENLDTGLDAFETAVTAKTGLFDYAIRSNYKSARSYSDFNKLRSTQKAWRTKNTLGKGGAKYLNTFKIIGRATGIASAGLAINDAIQNPTTGNIIQAFATTGLALVRINPLVGIGIGIMDVTRASDYLYDQLGNAIDNF